MIVEGSAGEVSSLPKACEIVRRKAVFEISAGGFPHALARALGCPIMMPLSPS